MSNAHPGRIIAQDVVPEDGSGESITSMPVSQSEIDDLLYGEDRTAGERVERLLELAEQLRGQEPGDFGGNDSGILLGAVDSAIARLSGGIERDPDLVNDTPSMDGDPLNHRETLSPDSDELEEIEEEDEASLTDGTEPLEDDMLDPEDFDDGEVQGERGVQ